jgi:hypothetical protein
VLVDEQGGHVLPEAVRGDLLLLGVAGQADLAVEPVQRGGAEGEGEDVVVLVGERSWVLARVMGVQLVDAGDRLLGPGVAGAVVPPQEVAADGVLDALQRPLDDLAVAAVPQRPGAVLGEVEVGEEVGVDEVEGEVVEAVGTCQSPDGLVVGLGIEPFDLVSNPAPGLAAAVTACGTSQFVGASTVTVIGPPAWRARSCWCSWVESVVRLARTSTRVAASIPRNFAPPRASESCRNAGGWRRSRGR